MSAPIHAPTILVSGQITANRDTGMLQASTSVKHMMQRLREQGANPVLVDHRTPYQREALLAADGIVFMGNDYDLDPSAYGQAPHPKTKPETKRCGRTETDFAMGQHRSAWEMAAMRDALDFGIPTLGICAGMQRMNIIGVRGRDGQRHGGTLYQHVEGLWQKQDMAVPVKYVSIDPDAKLGMMAAEIAPQQGKPGGAWTSVAVNSRQHQVIDRVARGFHVTAMCYRDGTDKNRPTIQAIELDDPYRFAMGVQWHPEFLQHPLSANIFAGLTDAARDRMQSKAVRGGDMGHLARLHANSTPAPAIHAR